jgi:hypothetical protein
MNTYQKDLIEEHSKLVVRINNLHNFIYSDRSEIDDKIEFANKCIQLAAMKKYEEALRARIENAGITFENGNYFENVATIEKIIVPPAIEGQGSDFDADGETASRNE